ncbi:LysR family transcriptional regulator [Legionella santicrucis]|uniref:LysR family transcriptional regulator n=1 Tax=Legionella santicrucis TaxID=45074 RepID=A0A0W0YI52_9GAMM|nr:LysR family transcriptional regulator [Legionella santicrucis]KTD56546.1 LysR family transcriptional regulator [Legionella santicrucis]
MKKEYSQLIIFYYVALLKSFTKAAEQLNYSKAYVSKQVAELEAHIAFPLFHRSTRSIQLTPAGESIFEHAALIVQEYQNIEHTIAGIRNKAEGLLRITAPPTYTDNLLAPNISHFMKEYPQIKLEMNISGQLLNLVDQKIDIAIRLTHEPPLDRVAKKMGIYQEIICASPDYLQLNTEPLHPKNLLNHDCLTYAYAGNPTSWPFLIESEVKSFNIKSKLAVNSSKVLLESTLNGLGIARLPSYAVHEAIKQKRLKSILVSYYPIPIPVYAIYVQSRVIPQKIRAFLNFIQKIHEKLQED